MINMHHLLNTYRPHQARQILITTMEKQIERRKEFLKDLDQYGVRASLVHRVGR